MSAYCPYCDEETEICHDDGYGYAEDETHEDECIHCGKKFAYTTSIHFYYDAKKADCLNEGECELEKVKQYPEYWPEWVRCKNCGYEKRGVMVNPTGENNE